MNTDITLPYLDNSARLSAYIAWNPMEGRMELKKTKPITRDPRYRAIKELIHSGAITKVSEIFEILPKSLVAKDLHMGYKSLINKSDHPNLFTVEDIVHIADIIGVSDERLFNIARNSYGKKIKPSGNQAQA